MTITKSEAAFLGRQAERPVKAAGELLALWVPGKLVNPQNQGWGWAKREIRYRKGWHERVALALWEAHWVLPNGPRRWLPVRHDPPASAYTPKSVTFHARTWGSMDSDGLQAALKPVRDALVECGVISGDADKDGNLFVYEQRIDRARRGVEIRVSLR